MLATRVLLFCLVSISAGDGNIARRAQYRGPFEQLLTPMPIAPPGQPGNIPMPTEPGASPLLNPVGFVEGYNRWEFWFELNKDLLLRSRDFRRRDALPSTIPDAPPPIDDGRVRAEDARKSIARALHGALRSTDERIVRFAALGLGRVGAREFVPELEELSAKADLETRRYATLALGMIDERSVLSKLVNGLKDELNPPEVRAAAALGIGLHGRREGARFLKDYLDRSFNSETVLGPDKDVFVAAILSLGMCRDREAAPLLTARYRTFHEDKRGRTRAVEVLILNALGRIGDPSGLPVLLEALEDKDEQTRRAAALALGDLGDRSAIKSLIHALTEDNDDQTRGFAAISLGRLGGEAARDALRTGFQTKSSRTVKAFTALGLGLLGDRGSAPEILKTLALHSEDDLRGAMAISLGLLEEPRAVEPLFKLVQARGTNADFRGYCAIALGMIRAEGVLEKLLKILEEDVDKVDLWRRGLCLGIGLYGDPKAAPALARVMAQDTRDVVREHAALALNLCRGRSEVETLTKRLEKETRGELALFCVAALSGMGDRAQFPLISEAFFNTNYRIRNTFLEDLSMFL